MTGNTHIATIISNLVPRRTVVQNTDIITALSTTDIGSPFAGAIVSCPVAFGDDHIASDPTSVISNTASTKTSGTAPMPVPTPVPTEWEVLGVCGAWILTISAFVLGFIVLFVLQCSSYLIAALKELAFRKHDRKDKKSTTTQQPSVSYPSHTMFGFGLDGSNDGCSGPPARSVPPGPLPYGSIRLEDGSIGQIRPDGTVVITQQMPGITLLRAPNSPEALARNPGYLAYRAGRTPVSNIPVSEHGRVDLNNGIVIQADGTTITMNHRPTHLAHAMTNGSHPLTNGASTSTLPNGTSAPTNGTGNRQSDEEDSEG